jgi:carbonic anhydrase/acetyltransferase-like protein (isoleucine patch superfamily)
MPLYEIDGIRPELPANGEYWIAPDAVLIGRVRVLRNASVWFGAVLRGDNEWITLGENSNVQDLSVIHTDPGQPTDIGADVTVGHRVILHSTTIGDGSLIGMGSTLLTGSNIGRNCLVGANTLVTEGKKFGDNMMILGVPARGARSLKDTELTLLKMSSASYVHNHRRFRSAMKLIELPPR